MKGNNYVETKRNILLGLQQKYNINLNCYNDYLYYSLKNGKKTYFLLILKEEVTLNYLNKIIQTLKNEDSLLYPLTFVTNKNIDESAIEYVSLFNGDLDILKVVC